MMKILYPFIAFRNHISKKIERHQNVHTSFNPVLGTDLKWLKRFGANHMQWKSDPARGFFDYIQSVEQMNYNYVQNWMITGDCDDLATYYAYLLKRMKEDLGITEIYRVNIFPRYRHVICVFRDNACWRYTSNAILCNFVYDSMETAIAGWCKSQFHKPTKWYYAERMM